MKGLQCLSPKGWNQFPVRFLLIVFLVLFAAIPMLRAQRDGDYGGRKDTVNVGGNWWEFSSEDPMTAARRATFTITSTSHLRDNRATQSRIDVYCENGKYKRTDFTPGVSLGPPTHPGFWGQPQMEVVVRVDNKHSNHGWNWNGRSLAMDKGTTRELMGAQLFRIEFLAPRGTEIAEFSPAGLDFGKVAHACDLSPKKP